MTERPPAPSALPARPSLERLRREAKGRLRELRAADPDAQLAQAQFQLARAYGFSSWRELKGEVDRRAGGAVGDWIGRLNQDARVALHLRRDTDGRLVGTWDSRDLGHFDWPLDDLTLDGDRLTFTIHAQTRIGVQEGFFDGRRSGEGWAGEWKVSGLAFPLRLEPGAWPPAPTLSRLDGYWDGWLPVLERVRLILRFRTDRHGTFAWLDSPDRNHFNMPARALRQAGRELIVQMKTATISGRLSEDGAVFEASFSRDGQDWPIAFARRAPGAAPPRRPPPPEVTLPREALEALAGDYAVGPGHTRMTLSIDGGRLYAGSPGQPRLALATVSRTEVYWRDIDASALFDMRPDGRASGFTLRQPGGDLRGERITRARLARPSTA